VLTTRGVVLAVGSVCSAIAGLVYGVEEFVLVAISVWVLFVVGAVSVWRRQGVSRPALRVTVSVPVPEVTAGQPAMAHLTVSNGARHRRPPVLVEDADGHWSVSHPGLGDSSVARSRPAGAPRGTGAYEGHAPSDAWLGRHAARRSRRERAADRRALSRSERLPDLGPGEHSALPIVVPTARRGLLTLSGVGLWCEDPFRLMARRVTVAPPAHVIVYPVPGALGPAGRASGAHPGDRTRSSADGTAPSPMSGDELSGLRPYAPGDRLTRLHWPALARSGELVVREFVEPQAGSLSLLVDVRPTAHTAESIDLAIARAAGLGVDALHRGLTVELCTSTGDRVVVVPNGAGPQTLLRALALVGPAHAPPAVVRRWGDRPTGGAVWATGSLQGNDVVLVTTTTGAAQPTLPGSLGGRAETVLVS
jgi:uncharacterized protein (DUF58 family)